MAYATSDVISQIRSDCDVHLPHEACGLLFGRFDGKTARIHRARAMDNVWPIEAERTSRFAIDPLDQLKAERAAVDGELVGFYHSHPKGLAVPSEFDRSRAWPKYVYVILGYDEPAGPTPRAWVLDDGGAFVEHRIQIEETF